jgi:demethylmenaquinone methyltransferase/2-methoxy-6-polyprenyl-1,4-benzoquinol methylase
MTQADSGRNPSRSARIPEPAADASSQNGVGEMFDRIAPTYALLNHILSFGLDFSWRRKLAQMLDGNHPIELLDLATGSGDLLISMLGKKANISKAVGLDISEKMLDVCRRNLERANLADRAALMQGDAGRTGLGESSFDVVTMAFGIRNVLDPSQTLAEMVRLLRAGGTVLILEFSLPANRILRSIYLVYLRHIVPIVGWLVARDKAAYRYLNTTIELFYRTCDIPDLMKKAGFANIATKPLTFGTVSLYSGSKP